MRKGTVFIILLSFIASCIMPPQGFAQTLTAVGLMPQPGTQVTLSPVFTPAHLKGMVINPADPFKFDFIVNRGDEALTDAQKQEEYTKLVKYFLAALAVPDTDQWVNLSPYEKDRIITDGFGLTEMGRDLLAQDYLLKQISASLTNPDTDLGKKFWNEVYEQAYQKYGTINIPTDTFNKVWITPDKAVVYEKGNSVIVLEQHLKVMLESDYKAMKENVVDEFADNDAGKISKQVMCDVILPAIEKEVNEGQGFAPLRQVYSGMLLATWYKVALKESILGKLYADQGKVKGVDQDPRNNQQIYDQYVSAFKKGVFNLIKEDVDRHSQEVIPRKYFSGGTVNDYSKIIKILKDGTKDAEEKLKAVQALLPQGVLAFVKDDDVVGVEFVNTGNDAEQFEEMFNKLKEQAPDNKVRMEDGRIHVDAAMTVREYLSEDIGNKGKGDEYAYLALRAYDGLPDNIKYDLDEKIRKFFNSSKDKNDKWIILRMIHAELAKAEKEVVKRSALYRLHRWFIDTYEMRIEPAIGLLSALWVDVMAYETYDEYLANFEESASNPNKLSEQNFNALKSAEKANGEAYFEKIIIEKIIRNIMQGVMDLNKLESALRSLKNNSGTITAEEKELVKRFRDLLKEFHEKAIENDRAPSARLQRLREEGGATASHIQEAEQEASLTRERVLFAGWLLKFVDTLLFKADMKQAPDKEVRMGDDRIHVDAAMTVREYLSEDIGNKGKGDEYAYLALRAYDGLPDNIKYDLDEKIRKFFNSSKDKNDKWIILRMIHAELAKAEKEVVKRSALYRLHRWFIDTYEMRIEPAIGLLSALWVDVMAYETYDEYLANFEESASNPNKLSEQNFNALKSAEKANGEAYFEKIIIEKIIRNIMQGVMDLNKLESALRSLKNNSGTITAEEKELVKRFRDLLKEFHEKAIENDRAPSARLQRLREEGGATASHIQEAEQEASLTRERVLFAGWLLKFVDTLVSASDVVDRSYDDQVITLNLTEGLTELRKLFGGDSAVLVELEGVVKNIPGLIEFIQEKIKAANPELKVKLEGVMAGLQSTVKGGIDFAQSNLDMQIKRDGAGVPLPISQQNLENIRIDGLVPVILNIRPAANAPILSQIAVAGASAV